MLAITELRTLLSAQWSTGMIPHIVFSENSTDYFPGFDRWGTGSAKARPSGIESSGICQPPVHSIALRHILDRGRENGGADREAAESFLDESFDGWLAWHRWLATVRDPDATGLIEIHHGWESGFDNSPRWDGPYPRVQPGAVPAFTRRDTLHVADSSERPGDSEYTKYLWLVQQMASVGYDDGDVRSVVGFRVRDVFFSAIMAASSDVLANEWISTDTVSGFAPLVSGGEESLLSARRTAGKAEPVLDSRGLPRMNRAGLVGAHRLRK